MSPFAIRSTYSAATFNGPITASSVLFTPCTISRYPPWNFSALPRVASFPSTAAFDSRSASLISSVIVPVMAVNELRSACWESTMPSTTSPSLPISSCRASPIRVAPSPSWMAVCPAARLVAASVSSRFAFTAASAASMTWLTGRAIAAVRTSPRAIARAHAQRRWPPS